MTITNGYCTLAEIKEPERLNIANTTYDTALEGVIEAVSREIDRHCARFFWKDTNDGTYYFAAPRYDSILIGDFVSITTLSTDDSANRSYQAWTVDTHYDLWPYNASADGIPYQMSEVSPTSGKRFPVGVGTGVKIVGKRGWPAVPKPIKEACLIWSMRTYKRYATPLGVSAMTAIGEMNSRVPPPDPDVMLLLSTYQLGWFA
jgi:hypothetical protein